MKCAVSRKDTAHCLNRSLWQILFHATLVAFHEEFISLKRRMKMSDNFLVEFSIVFAVKIVRLTDEIPK